MVGWEVDPKYETFTSQHLVDLCWVNVGKYHTPMDFLNRKKNIQTSTGNRQDDKGDIFFDWKITTAVKT